MKTSKTILSRLLAPFRALRDGSGLPLNRAGTVRLFPKSENITGCEPSGTADVTYMRRYRLLHAPAFGLYLHVFFRSDADVFQNPNSYNLRYTN